MKFVKLLFGSVILNWLTTRALHAPDKELPALCLKVGVTQDQWRRVESAIASRAINEFNKI